MDPPTCKHVRGIVFGNQVILEKLVMDDPVIRDAASKENLALLITVSTSLGEFHYKEGADKVLQKILDDLATESGYEEISTAPLLPIGHSGGGITVWNMIYWNPDRVIGGVTLHSAAILPPAWDKKATPDGVPVLTDSGEYESWGHPKEALDKHWRWLRGGLLNMRACYDEALVSEVVQPGAGHFSWDEPLARHVAMFIQKAAHFRIPPETSGTTPAASPAPSGKLVHLPMESGWLTDITLMTPSDYAPAPYAQFNQDPTLAFWHLDSDLAKSTEGFEAARRGKVDQRVTFVQDGGPIPAAWIETLKFDPVDDGMTMKLKAEFLTKTPEGVAGAGRPLTHAPGPIKFRLVGGWGGGGEQTGPDTFRIHFDNFGINRRTNNLMVMAFQEGDEKFAYAEQPAQIVYPEKNTQGTAQKISFPKIDDFEAGIAPVALGATSDSGLRVEYYVRSGPAIVDGTSLKLTPVPPRSKYPVKVTVVAYQWGRTIAPLFQSAEPVERTFSISAPVKAESSPAVSPK